MKILAMDKLLPGITLEKVQPHLQAESKHAWQLYARGIFRELYFRGDRPGAVIILECKDVEEAKKIMADLPLVKENLIEFEYIPLQHFAPFAVLFDKNVMA
jgi:hypothetical protein